MATGIQMLEAVREAIKRQPGVKELSLSMFDSTDLFELRASDLEGLGVDRERADVISADLANESFVEFGAWLGVKLIRDTHHKNLIPGEGLRRSAGAWAVEGEELDIDALVQEIRQLRHPEPR